MAGIQVLIPVLVDNEGRWVSNGWGKGDSPDLPSECPQPDWGLMDDCLVEMDEGPRVNGTREVWIKAWLPLPTNEPCVTNGQTLPEKERLR